MTRLLDDLPLAGRSVCRGMKEGEEGGEGGRVEEGGEGRRGRKEGKEVVWRKEGRWSTCLACSSEGWSVRELRWLLVESFIRKGEE